MKDYFANNRSFVDLIPSNLRDETNTSLIENLFDRFLTKDESIPMFGYVGKNTVSDPIQRLPQMDLDREINQLISTYVFSTGSTSHYFTPHDFFLKLKEDEKNGKAVLRTHTSSVQIRYMTEKMQELKDNKKSESEIFPIAIVCPGKVYRNEATDATHEAQFHQVEGLLVGENISLANLKAILEKFFSDLFEKDIDVVFRSSYFPFVEPGLEVAMKCFKCDGTGCNICKNTGYIEIMGAGMVHPKVLENCGIDSRKYTGFAFGGGIDRIAMLKYGLDDIRFLYNGDLRVINQF
jgi:phenylalanyl-tRNA synthetase alpha subunit